MKRMWLAVALAAASPCVAQVSYKVRLFWQQPSHPKARTIELAREDYVAAVLAGEAGAFRSEEGLKAMAVVARTFAHRFQGRHRAEGFDFCDTTHCQDLRLSAVTERLRQAAAATEGELLWYEGAPIAAFHHADCGGATAAAAELWPDHSAPYLRRLEDTYCISKGRSGWTAAISAADLRAALEEEGVRLSSGPGGIRIVRRSPSGRVMELEIGGRRISGELLHHAVGRRLGWHLLRSLSYEVSGSGGELLFRGYGHGHGVGLCQAGADLRGREGHSYRQILAFYYPGTVLGITARGFTWQYFGGQRLDLFTTRAGEERTLLPLAERLLSEAERRTGLPLSRRVRLRVYPTVAAFRDATGEPGWVAGSMTGATIRLQPPEVLRSAGALEATLLHELVHAVLDSHAHPSTPRWFSEGLALVLAPPAPSGSLPSAHRKFHDDSRVRVRGLLDRHGMAVLSDWLRRGLPAELKDRGRQE